VRNRSRIAKADFQTKKRQEERLRGELLFKVDLAGCRHSVGATREISNIAVQQPLSGEMGATYV